MKIKDYSPSRAIILGDFGEEAKEHPILTQEQIIAMQPPSTQAALNRDPAKDEEHFLRGDPPEEAWKRDYKWRREMSLNELVNFEGHRHSGEKFEEGYYRADKTSVIRADNQNGEYLAQMPNWRKEIVASKLKTNSEVLQNRLSRPKPEMWVDLPWYKALWHWFKGGEVRRD